MDKLNKNPSSQPTKLHFPFIFSTVESSGGGGAVGLMQSRDDECGLSKHAVRGSGERRPLFLLDEGSSSARRVGLR